MLAFLREASSRLSTLATADERLAELTDGSRSGPERTWRSAPTSSPGGRIEAAPALAGALERELQQLGMPGATIAVELDPAPELGPSGAEVVELRLSPSPGQKASSLAKTASGGELSRTMLACRSVMADLDDVPTLVFDEVDAGIGGEAGLAVGRRLARLAEGRQVLVVTHLPQIACFADRHILVEKDAGTATVRRSVRRRACPRALADARGPDGQRRRRHPRGGAPGDRIRIPRRLRSLTTHRPADPGLRDHGSRGLPSSVTPAGSGRERISSSDGRIGQSRKEPTRPRPRPEGRAAGRTGEGARRASRVSTVARRTSSRVRGRETSR